MIAYDLDNRRRWRCYWSPADNGLLMLGECAGKEAGCAAGFLIPLSMMYRRTL